VRARPCCRQAALDSMVRGFREGVKPRGRAVMERIPTCLPEARNLTRLFRQEKPLLARFSRPGNGKSRSNQSNGIVWKARLCGKPDWAESQAAGRSDGSGARTRPTNRGSEAPQARKFARAAVRLRMPLGPPRTTSASTSSWPSSCHQHTGQSSKTPGAVSVRLPQHRQRTFVVCIPGLQSKHRRPPDAAVRSAFLQRLHRTALTASL
jgi:hypothetical protein